MKSYNEYGNLQEFIQYTPRPVVRTVYFAMKNGEVREFESKVEALAFSNLIERVQSKIDIEAQRSWDRVLQELKDQQFHLWMLDLRKEFKNLSGVQFDQAFEKASQETESYDELYECISGWYEIFF